MPVFIVLGFSAARCQWWRVDATLLTCAHGGTSRHASRLRFIARKVEVLLYAAAHHWQWVAVSVCISHCARHACRARDARCLL
ncbi:hypothetical protein C8T65DRAFT_659109 [Cerioporus squamosus]|nr:hypothetical protein C8T65DRAFT_659109 [Cerioporus squamosus]